MFSTISISKDFTFILNILQFVFEIIGIYIFWIIAHFVAANMYSTYCANLSVWGFIESPFLVTTPHCTSIRWVINTGGNIINQMWVVFGTWIAGFIFTKFFSKNNMKDFC